MKLLMIVQDLGVKQYHLACALTDSYDVECHLSTLNPFGLNWRRCFLGFPNVKNMYRGLHNKVRRIQAGYSPDPFITISEFNQSKVFNLDPDVIYVSSTIYGKGIEEKVLNLDYPIILDVEDSILLDRDVVKSETFKRRLDKEKKLVSFPSVMLVLWGSDGEKNAALKYYKKDANKKSFITVYPYVAERTIPKYQKEKKELSVVYAGSIWEGGYRDYFPIIERIGKKGINLTIYMSNSFNRYNWNKLRKTSKKYSSVLVENNYPFHEIKEELSQFQIGLTGFTIDCLKYRATFGMKPMEYAYAGVQPASIGNSINNISDDKEFGYRCSPETLLDDYQYNLHRFDWNYHLMDNRLDEVNQLCKELTL